VAKRPKLPKGYYWRGAVIWRSTDPVTKDPKSTELKDPKGIKQWESERDRLARDPRYAAASKETFGEWYAITLTFKAARSSSKTLKFYKQKLGHFRRIWGDGMLMVNIVPDLCDSYVAQRRADGVTDHTIVKEFSCLTQLLKLARRAGKYPHEIAALKPLDLSPHYTPRDRALTVDEVKALLAFSSRRLRTFIELTVGLALRLSEALRVRRGDVDLEQCTFKVRGSKTKASSATVPILAPMRSLVEDAVGHLPIVEDGCEYLNIRRDLAAACERAGIRRCTPNDLRRTHATLLREAGVSFDLIRDMLRHTTTRMAEMTYAKPRAEAIARNIERHTESLQLTAPATTDSTTVDPWRSRKGSKKPRNQGANLEGRTPDLRFTKPNSGQGEIAELSGNISASDAAETHENAPNLASNTTPNTTPESASPAAWSLALAYRDVLARRVA